MLPATEGLLNTGVTLDGNCVSAIARNQITDVEIIIGSIDYINGIQGTTQCRLITPSDTVLSPRVIADCIRSYGFIGSGIRIQLQSGVANRTGQAAHIKLVKCDLPVSRCAAAHTQAGSGCLVVAARGFVSIRIRDGIEIRSL